MRHSNQNRVLSMLLVLVMVFSMLPITTVAAEQANHVVLNQIYGGGGNSGAEYKNDFVELYNPTNADVDLTGWSVQYASKTGSFNNITALTGTIKAGGYYLVQLAKGNGGTLDLPTPDAIGTAAMSATEFKVALVNNAEGISGIGDENVVDFFGAGAANEYEGSASAKKPSNTTAAVRKELGVDTDDNAADFTTAAPDPKNSAVGGTTDPSEGTESTTSTEPSDPPAPTGTEYVKTATIAAGDTVVLYNAGSGTLVSSTASGYKLNGVTAAPNGDVIVTADETVAWTVGVVDGKYTFTQGDKMLGMVVSGTYVNLSTKASDGATTWELSQGTAAATWYLKNPTIPASTYGDYHLEYYNGYTAYASSSPSDGQFGFVFYKVEGDPTFTKSERIADGDKVVLYNAGSSTMLSSTASGYKLAGVAATPENDKIVTLDETVVWTVGVSDGKYTFTQGDKVLGMVASGSYVNMSTKASDGATTWELSQGTAAATWYLKNPTIPASTYGDYYLEYYNGYTAYASSSPSDGQFGIVFYRLGGALAAEPDPEPEDPVVPEGTPATLVTDVSKLAVGDKIVIVAPSKSAIMGPLSGNYYASVTEGVTLSDNKDTVYFDKATTQIVTLGEGSVAGTWSFEAAGAYLSANGGTSNYLRSDNTVTAEASWTVQIDASGIATIKSNGSSERNWIRYNPSSPRFSCYKSGQSDIAIYKLAPEGGKLTSADQFVSGNYAMVVADGYAMGALDGTWVSVVQPTIEGDVLTDAKGGIWTLTVNGSNVTITDKNGVSIMPKGGNNNGISSGTYEWAWSFDAATGTFTFAGQGSDTVMLASNANEDPTYGGFHKFRAYKNTTISANPATYPTAFTLYPISEGGTETTLPEAGAEVVIYNLSAKGVLAAESDAQTINAAAATIEDGKAVATNGAVVFKVEIVDGYYRFYNETYGYLCSNGTGNNAFYSATASADADWTLAVQGEGFTMESRTAKFNDKYSQYLEYYGDSFKTYSMYNVNDYDMYTFQFYPLAAEVAVTGGIVNDPKVTTGTLLDAYKTVPYEFSFTVDAPFGVKELKVMLGNDELTATANGGTYYVTIPGDKVTGEKLTITFSGKDNKDAAIESTIEIPVKDEPVITDLTPAAGVETGAEKKPVISATIANAGDGAQISMKIGDEAVEAKFENGVISYTPTKNMADGRISVTVSVKRADGKEAIKTWSFTIGEAQYQLYFGQMHSHTTYSDGSGSLESALSYIEGLPESANVDFVAFTDHSNYFDGSSAGTTANPEGALYDMSLASDKSQQLWNSYKSAIASFNSKQNNVVAIGGFEMTWSGGPGHINTFNTPGIVSRNNSTLNNKTSDAGMKAYYALLSQAEGADSISQFNHPGSTFGTFSDFAYWDALLDTRIRLVEVGNGEGQIGAGGYYPSYEYYTMALDKGWHVAPTNNQDNHKGKWGNANNARDVILTDDFSEAGIYQAIRDRRVYATEDKNLEIYYTVNGKQLGTIISEVPEKLDLNVTLYDPDASDSISKVEVIVNSGKTVHTWSDPAVLATGELTATLAPDYSYYYIRVTQGDGDLAVTAPVWVGDTLKLGISSVESGTSTPVTGEELTITTTLFNSESAGAEIKSLTYTADGSTVIGTDTEPHTIPAAGNTAVEFKYTPSVAKITKITVTAVVEQNGKEYIFTMDVTLDVQDADKLVYIGIDASHYNEYVNGNYKDSMGNFGLLAAEYSVRTVQLNTSADLIAACSNPKYKAMILTAPSRRLAEAQANPKVYTAEELDALDAFNKAGGMVILAGWSDNYENYDVILNGDVKHMAETQNDVLAKLGSSLRIGDDATYDDVRSAADGVDKWRLYFNTYGDSFLTEGVEVDAENPYDRLYTEVFSHYGGATVYTVDGTLPATVKPVVYAHSTTYSVDVDKDGLGGTNIPKYTYASGDERLMVMASEQLSGRGLIVVSGAAFMSNFEVQATIEDSGSEKNYSNYKICENLLANLNPTQITNIADVQKQTEIGFKYTVEGIVTSNASGYDKDTAFFDCIYVQDASGGICCFPVAGNYKIGDKVRVTGTTEFYQGEMELQVSAIEVIGEGTVEPKNVTAAQINDKSVIGQLVTVKGTVVSFQKENGLVQTILVKDAKGDTCRVFIDGYITTQEDVKNLKEGCNITVTGLASYDDTFALNPKARAADTSLFPRIRVRNRADVVCTAASSNPNTGDNFQPVIVIGVMLAAAIGMCVMVLGKKKWII